MSASASASASARLPAMSTASAPRLATEAERDESRRWRGFIDGMVGPGWMAWPGGLVEHCNLVWCDRTGLTAERSEGDGWMRALHADDVGPVGVLWRQALESGHAFTCHCRLILTAGVRWHLLSVWPARAVAGEALMWFAMWSDVHDHYRRFERAGARARDLEAAFHAMPEPVVLARGLSVVLANPAAWRLGVRPDSEEPLSSQALRLGDRCAGSGQAVAAADHPLLVALAGHMAQRDLGSGDGDEAPVRRCVAAPFHVDGQPPGAVAVLSDLTENYRSARLLRQLNDELTEFASVAAHDLKEPLRLIGNYLDLLRLRLSAPLDYEARCYLARASSSAERMHALIDGLLELARIGRHQPAVERLDAAEVIGEAMRNLVISGSEERAIQVTPLPAMHGDRRLLVLLFQNLLSNALKYRRPDSPPRIVIEALPASGETVIAVSDNGIGIAGEHREEVFVAFHRVHAHLQYPGSGLGLSICRKIVERHGGRIWVESEPGEGSSFFIALPAPQEAMATE